MSDSTTKKIKQCFHNLLEEMPLDKITVKDISDKCNINRNTFYYHYSDISSLLEDCVQNDLMKILRLYPNVDEINEVISKFSAYAAAHPAFSQNLCYSNKRDVLHSAIMNACSLCMKRYLEGVFEGLPISEKDANMMYQHYAFTAFGYIVNWFDSNMDAGIIDNFNRLQEIKKGLHEETIRRLLRN